jgi:predicted XRE-type DNA-binding protein
MKKKTTVPGKSAAAAKPEKRVRIGSALAAIGRKYQVTDEEVATFENARDKTPAKPVALVSQSFYNVWDALCDTGGDATKMKLRSWLAMELERHIKAQGWSKAEAKKRCGPRLAGLNGKFSTFTADELAELLGEAGLELRVRAVKSTFGKTPPERRKSKKGKEA